MMVKTARWGFDFVTRYKHSSPEEAMAALKRDGKEGASLDELRAGGYVMTEKQWMQRILFLESVAGVPGMVAGTVRHLRSLRLMERDGGWIHSLLEEAENERMHLMTFMKIRQPGKAFRLLVMATQGVFYNLFFLVRSSPLPRWRLKADLDVDNRPTSSHPRRLIDSSHTLRRKPASPTPKSSTRSSEGTSQR